MVKRKGHEQKKICTWNSRIQNKDITIILKISSISNILFCTRRVVNSYITRVTYLFPLSCLLVSFQKPYQNSNDIDWYADYKKVYNDLHFIPSESDFFVIFCYYCFVIFNYVLLFSWYSRIKPSLNLSIGNWFVFPIDWLYGNFCGFLSGFSYQKLNSNSTFETI